MRQNDQDWKHKVPVQCWVGWTEYYSVPEVSAKISEQDRVAAAYSVMKGRITQTEKE